MHLSRGERSKILRIQKLPKYELHQLQQWSYNYIVINYSLIIWSCYILILIPNYSELMSLRWVSLSDSGTAFYFMCVFLLMTLFIVYRQHRQVIIWYIQYHWYSVKSLCLTFLFSFLLYLHSLDLCNSWVPLGSRYSPVPQLLVSVRHQDQKVQVSCSHSELSRTDYTSKYP